ncbi:Histone-lysine N-methyltransferase SETMAR, partial [Ooceraea biroi]
VYASDAVAERTVQKWFARFKRGDFNVEDQERSGRPSAVDDDQIAALIESNPRYTTRDIATDATEILHISNSIDR